MNERPNHSLRLNKVDLFTHRGMEIVDLMLEGKNNKEIASELSLAVQTIKNHKSAVYGAIEKETGQRPFSPSDMIRILIQCGIAEITVKA